MRVFAQADTEATCLALLKSFGEYVGMQHFSGFHLSLDMRTALPRSYLAFYPALDPQDRLDEKIVLLSQPGTPDQSQPTGHPPKYQKTPARENFDTPSPVARDSFGPTTRARLGDIVLARSGDKGANINIGLFVRVPAHYPWLRSFLTRHRMTQLMGDDWRPA